MYASAAGALKSSEAELEQRLREEQRENLALLPAQTSDCPKTEAELLQDKQRLSLQLQQTRKQMEVITSLTGIIICPFNVQCKINLSKSKDYLCPVAPLLK